MVAHPWTSAVATVAAAAGRGSGACFAWLASGQAADVLARAARSWPRVAGGGAAALALLGSRRGQAADAVASTARL